MIISARSTSVLVVCMSGHTSTTDNLFRLSERAGAKRREISVCSDGESDEGGSR